MNYLISFSGRLLTTTTTLLQNATIYNGSGLPPTRADILIRGHRIAAIGNLRDESASHTINLDGLAVAPGFINMLSWATESLIEDGRSMSDIKQGVTLEVMGEGTSMGPLNDAMKQTRDTILSTADIHYDIEWTTLGEYLEFLERKGVATNVASFVGSATLRVHAAGYDDRPVSDSELNEMKRLLHEAMREGAMGMSAALIYPPATYQTTAELIELCRVVAEYDGMYITHLRSESAAFHEALDELLEIMRATGVTGEIYHLKAAGAANWHKMDEIIERVEAAREEGLPLTADMYTYPYSGTGLASCIPAWAHDGGFERMIERLKDPATRERIKADMRQPTERWENLFQENGADGIMLCGFAKPEMRRYQGLRLSEVVAERGTSPEDTAIDLLIEDNSRIFSLYFSMSEANLRKQVQLPWVSFCSDAGSIATEGAFLSYHPHPRAYGSFARVLGKYVRDEGLVNLADAVRRLSGFVADNLKLRDRGYLKPGYCADIAIFDPAKVQDHSVPGDPHHYSAGMVHVFVNGVQVLRDGAHTGNLPGRVARGPGWAGG